MDWKVLFVIVIFVLYVLVWAWWFLGMYKIKKELDRLDKQTRALMQQAFKETRELQADIQAAIDEQ